MNKLMTMIGYIATIGCIGACGYVLIKSKKNMLDVIIEEIETMR